MPVTSFSDYIKQSRQEDGKLIAYSNRPPVNGIAGGAVLVIGSTEPDIWIGPGDTISDERWKTLRDENKFQLNEDVITSPEGKDVRVITFPVPESLANAQYNVIANGVLWPVFHSMDPETYQNPSSMFNDVEQEKQEYLFDLRHTPQFQKATQADQSVSTSLEYVEQAYSQFKEFNGLANIALDRLKHDLPVMDNGEPSKAELITDRDTLWVHDYQCIDVPGGIFSRHTPFPSLDYLKKVTFENGEGQEAMPLLETDFFNDYIQNRTQNGLISFQRPVDMQNFIEVVEHLHDKEYGQGHFAMANEHLYPQGKLVIDESFGVASQKPIKAFGHSVTLMTMPVGISQDQNREEAQAHHDSIAHYDASKHYDHQTPTAITLDNLARSGITLGATDTTNMVENGAPDTITLGQLLEHYNALDDGHHIIASWHRNDFTKNTMEKLQAMDVYLSEHPEEQGNTHFVLGLQPTRSTVPGYKEYQDTVIDYARSLHEKYEGSIIVIPQSINHGDLMGLLRHENVVGAIGAGMKDGHDLTVREAVDAKSDIEGTAMTIITTDGVGAADILKGTDEQPGAFIINTDQSKKGFARNMADMFETIIDAQSSEKGMQELTSRYEVMKEASAHYSAAEFGRAVKEAHQNITKYRDNAPSMQIAI